MITQKRLLEILEKSDGQDKASFYCDMLLSILIVLNLIAISLESVESIGLRYSSFFFVFEMVWRGSAKRKKIFMGASRAHQPKGSFQVRGFPGAYGSHRLWPNYQPT